VATRVRTGGGPIRHRSLRYAKTRGKWSLHWRDRNLRFHEYDLVDPTPHVDDLIAEIERDPTAIFWG